MPQVQIVRTGDRVGTYSWTDGFKESNPQPKLRTEAQVIEYCAHLENLGLDRKIKQIVLEANRILDDFCGGQQRRQGP